MPARKAEPLEKIALRCWVEPEGWAPKSSARRRIRWKENFLVLHTLGANGESGPLWFGVALLCHSDRVLRTWLVYREGIPASDVAEILGTTTIAVKSALQRARDRLEEISPTTDSVAEPSEPEARALLDQYIRAFETSDAKR